VSRRFGTSTHDGFVTCVAPRAVIKHNMP